MKTTVALVAASLLAAIGLPWECSRAVVDCGSTPTACDGDMQARVATVVTSCADTSDRKPEEPPELAAVTAADDARVAAFKQPTTEALEKIFSPDLHYAHSNGVIDTKASFMDVLTSGKTKYLGFDYEERRFSIPAPGIALMTGKARIRVVSGDSALDTMLSFLAVWRLEDGTWRFLAWQSCRLPPAAAK